MIKDVKVIALALIAAVGCGCDDAKDPHPFLESGNDVVGVIEQVIYVPDYGTGEAGNTYKPHRHILVIDSPAGRFPCEIEPLRVKYFWSVAKVGQQVKFNYVREPKGDRVEYSVDIITIIGGNQPAEAPDPVVPTRDYEVVPVPVPLEDDDTP